MKWYCSLLLFAMVMGSCNGSGSEYSLSGEWDLVLDSLFDPEVSDISLLEYDRTIELPNTLDKAGIGKPLSIRPELSTKVMRNLHRKVKYIGPAYYTRQIHIPRKWKDQHISLAMERIIWESTVWIDGKKVGSGNSLSTPHLYDLSNYLTPGSHSITLRIDNRRQVNISKHDYAHAYTKETQTIWNGILGRFFLTARPHIHIGSLDVYPDFTTGKVRCKAELSEQADKQMILHWNLRDSEGKVAGAGKQDASGTELLFTVKTDTPVQGWNEHHPSLYTLETTLRDQNGKNLDSRSVRFGFRNVEKKNGHMVINNQKVFLRGTLECCIFPLTGHPPVSKTAWKEVLQKARAYGLNHLRFHSWCPPEAAFEAADELGFYFQVELPNWSLSYGEDPAVVRYMKEEADRILKAYGHHPSFLLFCMGNELMGNFELINGLVKELKEKDSRHLYTATAFTFQEEHWGYHEPFDDFYVTQWTDSGWVRGQGVFDQEPPSFQHNYDQAIRHIEIPVISHEIGQYTVYPKLDEITKYTGVLSPVNLIAVRNDLEAKGRLEMASRFTEATGKFATILYKEEIERAYKTSGLSGFQLLDLHDFPGQGTALVGMLDAFWESKGFTTGEEFSRFCSDVVPLLWFEKAVYTRKELFRAEAGLSNYSGDLETPDMTWSARNSQGISVAEGTIRAETIPHGSVSKMGPIEFPLEKVPAPSCLTIELSLNGTSHRNAWQIWVYDSNPPSNQGDVVITSSFQDAGKALASGRKVLLSPPLDQIKGITGKFVPVFWSPVHFPNQPGTMGILCDPSHPVFDQFPTDFHANWQWWDISKYSEAIQIDSLQVDPLVRVLDNFFKNRALCNLFEAKVGEGALVFSSIDLANNLDKRLAARQLRTSILNYMNSGSFQPERSIAFRDLQLFHEVSDQEPADVLSIYE